MAEFDYDRSDIHLSYDESRKLPEETMQLWLDTLSEHAPRESIRTIVDMGCGTGRFTEALASHYSATVYGIDPSQNMLTQAKQDASAPHTQLIQGTAEAIPLPDDEVDLIFLSMVYHHIRGRDKALNEFARILRTKGFLCIRTGTVDCLDSYPWLRFFPTAYQIEADRLPSRKTLVETIQTAGFERASHSVVHHYFAKNLHQYFGKISLRGLSSLKAITDDEFQEGVARLGQYCREHETGEAIYEDIDLFAFRNA